MSELWVCCVACLRERIAENLLSRTAFLWLPYYWVVSILSRNVRRFNSCPLNFIGLISFNFIFLKIESCDELLTISHQISLRLYYWSISVRAYFGFKLKLNQSFWT